MLNFHIGFLRYTHVVAPFLILRLLCTFSRKSVFNIGMATSADSRGVFLFLQILGGEKLLKKCW